MSTEKLIKFCSPTLAGLKTGSMFSCKVVNELVLRKSIAEFNHKLVKKGVRIIPIFCEKGNAIIYVYRPMLLRKDLTKISSVIILKKYGYSISNINKCVAKLANKLKYSNEFPNEIGLFLGYPAKDVRGFIENNAERCKFSGMWKVYGNVKTAKRKFVMFKKCTGVYMNILSKYNNCIERLTVSEQNLYNKKI